MHLKILGHPVFTALNFHMPMIVDLSHPLIVQFISVHGRKEANGS